MMEQQTTRIFLSNDIQELLADNSIDLVRVLREQGVQIHKGYEPSQGQIGGSQTKDVTLVILSSGVSLAAISWGIAKIIDSLGRNKKVVVKERRRVPLTDSNGKILRSSDGNPIIDRVEEWRMLEASKTTQDESKVSASWHDLSFELVSGKGA